MVIAEAILHNPDLKDLELDNFEKPQGNYIK